MRATAPRRLRVTPLSLALRKRLSPPHLSRLLLRRVVVPARVTTPSLLHRVCPVLVALALSPVRVVRVRRPRVRAVMALRARVVRARRVVDALVVRARGLPALALRVRAVMAARVLVVLAPVVTVARVRAVMAVRAPLRQLLAPLVHRAPTRA